MKYCKLDTYLEATDMGKNQHEIAAYVENTQEWQDYVAKVNQEKIPINMELLKEDVCTPTEEWWDKQTFHADQLIKKACDALQWHSVPQSGGLIYNFYAEESD